MSDRLYEDVHSGEIVMQHSSELAARDEAEADEREVTAIEEGTRYRPDGTVEEYRRAEF